jgi:hypothetical protein
MQFDFDSLKQIDNSFDNPDSDMSEALPDIPILCLTLKDSDTDHECWDSSVTWGRGTGMIKWVSMTNVCGERVPVRSLSHHLTISQRQSQLSTSKAPPSPESKALLLGRRLLVPQNVM